MTLDPDPYRTLGLSRGATLDEVKRAYRRLAKVNHPDAAGEAALPRFLAIQAAYEQLAGGWVAPRGRGAASAPRHPWDADTERSDATRRAYGGRARGATPGAGGGTGSPGGQASSGTAGSSGTSGKPGAKAGSSGAPRADRGPRSEPGTNGRRRSTDPGAGAPGASDGADPGRSDGPPGKATLGSTSYDGADAGPFEPDWGGASWYGTTSGTYWTLNPKEYADPRKHGPEYQARARRAARARGPGTGSNGEPDATADDAADQDAADPSAPPEAGTSGPSARAEAPPAPEHTTRSWWESTAGAGAVPPSAENGPGDRRQGFRAAAGAIAYDASPPDLGRAASDFLRALVDERSGGPRGRVVRAVIGWLPIAFGFSWLVGEVTGCGRFAATCDTSVDPLITLVQIALLAVLIALPVLAAMTAMAAITLLSTAFAVALILSASGGAADSDSRRTALGALLLLAWFAGLAFAIVRRVRTLGPPTRPVS